MTTDKPGVDLNLDNLEREGRPEQFAFILKGERYVAQDPTDLDWRVTATFGQDPQRSMRALLGDEHYEKFTKHRIPDWKVGRLLKAVMAHYGFGELGEDSDSSGS